MHNSIDKTEFLKRALKKNNEKYDYSEIEFKSMQENITVRCNLHNILFTQTPLNHLRTTGCPKCSHEKRKLGKRISKEEFIKRSNIIHNNKYDYSNIDFVDIETPILIKCDIHDVFLQRPTDHLAKCGCKKCGYIKNGKLSRNTTEKFIEKCLKIEKFKNNDYSVTEYTKSSDKVKIICKIHGLFETNAGDYMLGKGGCLKCCNICHNKEDFIFKANEKWNNKYNYSLVEYTKGKNKVKIICPIHGVFELSPVLHLFKQECPTCTKERIKRVKPIEKVLEDFKRVHRDKYEYDLTGYENTSSYINIFCKNCKTTFKQTAGVHTTGCGCKKCNMQFNTFKKEDWVKSGLNKEGIFYIIKCWNETEEFYKAGITYQKSIKNRYNGTQSMPYNWEIYYESKSFDLEYIWELEKIFMTYNKENHYKPSLYFKGSKYECFK